MMSKYKKKHRKSTKSPTIDEWLQGYIDDQVEGEEYVDNYRWAVIGDPKQMDEYNKRAEQGCCGSFDGEVTGPDGLAYLVGCNYGH